jgi:C4-dicarboxylate-specific signal transduction histidine kinase
MRQGRWPWFPLVGALVGAIGASAAAGRAEAQSPSASPQDQRHVLLLWGGRPDLPANIVVNQAIRTTLHKEFGSDVDIRFEYVEEPANPGDEQPALRDFLRHKYASGRFDLVIAIAPWAVSFARMHARELFPGTPIVCWLGTAPTEDWGPGPPLTVVSGTLDPGDTIDLILHAQPATSQIVVIAGGSLYDDAPHEARVQDAVRRYENRLTLTYLTDLPLEEVRKRVADLPDRTAILYAGMHGDGAGRRLVSVDALASIAKSANAPVYVMAASYLGVGTVGGVVVDQRTVSEEAARVAVRILRGARVEEIPSVRVPAVPMVDWRQLRRWDIRENRLPPGTVVLYREPSMWEAYRGRVIGVAAVCIGQAVLIVALLFQHRRRRRAERLRVAVLASLHDHVAILDAAGQIVEINDSWGRFARENGGKIPSHPLPPANYLAAWRGAAESADRVGSRALSGLEAVLAGSQPRFQLEYPCPTPSGPRWFEMSVEPLRRPEGGAVVTHTEITARREAVRAEQEQHRQLAHLGRVAMLGELTGTLAHELNQPLTAILSNAQAAQHLLGADRPDLDEVRDSIDDIVSADRRAGEVIRRLRGMLKRTDAQLQSVDVNEVAREVVDLAHGDLLARGVTVAMHLQEGLPAVRADRVQLQQVLLNLILNGCDAMDLVSGPKELTVTSGRDGDGRVEVRVRDRGVGIASEDVQRIFEPFFTSKREGLGLGLAICRTIATAHGGRLWATNNDDRGATLHLVLPCGDGDARRPSSGAQ